LQSCQVPPDTYLLLAEVTSRDGRIQDARDALLRYATLIGDDKPLATVATRIADYSVRLGEPALAVRWFDRAIDEAGPSAALQVKLADARTAPATSPARTRLSMKGWHRSPGNLPLQRSNDVSPLRTAVHLRWGSTNRVSRRQGS
jgi:hypothetical protein